MKFALIFQSGRTLWPNCGIRIGNVWSRLPELPVSHLADHDLHRPDFRGNFRGDFRGYR